MFQQQNTRSNDNFTYIFLVIFPVARVDWPTMRGVINFPKKKKNSVWKRRKQRSSVFTLKNAPSTRRDGSWFFVNESEFRRRKDRSSCKGVREAQQAIGMRISFLSDGKVWGRHSNKYIFFHEKNRDHSLVVEDRPQDRVSPLLHTGFGYSLARRLRVSSGSHGKAAEMKSVYGLYVGDARRFSHFSRSSFRFSVIPFYFLA